MSEKPAVTREQYEQGRAVLDALPPGYYFKCTCGKWLTGDSEIIKTFGKSLCRSCFKAQNMTPRSKHEVLYENGFNDETFPAVT